MSSLIERARELQRPPVKLPPEQVSEMGILYGEIYREASRLVDEFGQTTVGLDKKLEVEIEESGAPGITVILETRRRRGSPKCLYSCWPS